MPKTAYRAMVEAMELILEAQQVVALRMMKLAAGGPAVPAEIERMLSEKAEATVDAANLLSAGIARGAPDGGSGDVVEMLHRKVRANRKRLTEGGPT